MTEWYYSDAERRQQGPISADDLAALHARGELGPDALVWREGLDVWKPWKEMIGEVVAQTPVAATLPQRDTAVEEDLSWTVSPVEQASPYAPPQAQVEERDTVISGGKVVYAGFWKRFAAYCIDYVIVTSISYAVMIPIFMIGAVSMGSSGSFDSPGDTVGVVLLILGYLVAIFLPLVYFSWMPATKYQATLGKLAVGIKIVRGDGGRISLGRGIGRIFATLLSSLILFIGWIMAGFTERKQALHDMVCDTLVVDKWAYTDHPEWQREELGAVTITILVLVGLGFVGIFGLIAFVGVIAGSGLR